MRVLAMVFLTFCSTVPDPQPVPAKPVPFKEQCPVEKPICIRWEIHPDHLKCTKVMDETKTYDQWVNPPCVVV